MKDILVIGATGKQGNAVVKQLLEDGWYVSALTRNKNNRKLSDIGHPHLSIVEGDLSDNVSLQSAMKVSMAYTVFSQSLKMMLAKN